MGNNLPINYKFIFDFLSSKFEDLKNIKVLDFGCGDGKLIKYANQLGYDFYGIENYYDDKEYEKSVEKENDKVIKIEGGGKIPYKDESFDFIYSNQVIEHVKDLDFYINEMNRILKKNGMMLHIFPCKQYIIEGHIGIPLFHRIPKSFRLRKTYLKLCYSLNIGYKWEKFNKEENILKWMNFVDNFCTYRSIKDITDKFNKNFSCLRIDKEKLIYLIDSRDKIQFEIISKVVRLVPNVFITSFQLRRGSISLLCLKI